jgi:succinyl-CoA synthetase beta subunit
LNELQAYQLLDQLGLPHAPCLSIAINSQAPQALPFDYPVVLKVCSVEIAHKTEVGGVLLDLRDQAALQQALVRLRANLAQHAPDVLAEQALIQPMRKGLAEVLIGYKVDPDAGPIVMLAAGGIWAELASDRSIRLAPVSVSTAQQMISEVRMLQTVAGLRGKPRGDLQALAQAISDLSQLAVQPQHRVVEAEINPLLVMAEGVLAVDALVLLSQG